MEEGKWRMEQYCAHSPEAGAWLGDSGKSHCSGPSETFQIQRRASGEDGADGFGICCLIFNIFCQMNESVSWQGYPASPCSSWPAWSSPVSTPIVFICTISARLLVLHAIEPPRSKGIQTGAQDAQAFAEEGFINKHLQYGHLQRKYGSSYTRREAWAVAQNKYSLCCLKHFACGWSLVPGEKMKSGPILLLPFWDDGNEASPHGLHVEISLLKISSRIFQKDCFGLVSCRQRQRSKYSIHLSCLFIPCSSLVLRLFNPSHTTMLRKFKQITEMSNESGLQNEGSLFVRSVDIAEENYTLAGREN